MMSRLLVVVSFEKHSIFVLGNVPPAVVRAVVAVLAAATDPPATELPVTAVVVVVAVVVAVTMISSKNENC